MSQKYVPGVLEFFDNVCKETSYEDKEDAEATFSEIREQLPAVIQSTDGMKVIRFAEPQALRATSENSFRNVIKVVWRMTKAISGSPEYKLGLFIVGAGVVCGAVRSSSTADSKAAGWISGVESWLGMQWTIGGKGHTGEGQGSVLNRIRFGEPQAIRATSESSFRDVIKVIWRMTKAMSGSPEHKLSLFMLGVGVVCSALRTSPTAHPKAAEWIRNVETWLGTQLTIGGKGCTGEGEGSVGDRIRRFLSTPYLHDFD